MRLCRYESKSLIAPFENHVEIKFKSKEVFLEAMDLLKQNFITSHSELKDDLMNESLYPINVGVTVH